MTGFYIDERIGLAVTPGCGWNEKASTQWKCADFTAPPPKSKLLATMSHRIGASPYPCDPDITDNGKQTDFFDFELDWGKGESSLVHWLDDADEAGKVPPQ